MEMNEVTMDLSKGMIRSREVHTFSHLPFTEDGKEGACPLNPLDESRPFPQWCDRVAPEGEREL